MTTENYDDTVISPVVQSKGKFPTFHDNGVALFKLITSLDNPAFAERMMPLLQKLKDGKHCDIKGDLKNLVSKL